MTEMQYIKVWEDGAASMGIGLIIVVVILIFYCIFWVSENSSDSALWGLSAPCFFLLLFFFLLQKEIISFHKINYVVVGITILFFVLNMLIFYNVSGTKKREKVLKNLLESENPEKFWEASKTDLQTEDQEYILKEYSKRKNQAQSSSKIKSLEKSIFKK